MSTNFKIEDQVWAVETLDPPLLLPNMLPLTCWIVAGQRKLPVGLYYNERVAQHVVLTHNATLLQAFTRWMQRSGTSVMALAVTLGVAKTTIYHWLRGEYRPSSSNIQQLEILSGGEVGPHTFRAAP